MIAAEDRSAVLARRPVSRETVRCLDAYAGLLRSWQRHTNLVAPSTLDLLWSRHFEEGIALFDLVPTKAGRIVDLGSGGGLPGLVLSILFKARGAGSATLVESNGKKAAFLRSVVRELDLDCTVRAARIEASADAIAAADVVTARALAPLEALCGLVAGHLKPGAICLFPKGREHTGEIEAASQHFRFDMVKHSSTGAPGSVVLELGRLRRTGDGD